MQAVILAAGRGKRLQPITLKRSKAMLPILGKPIVARIIDSIASIRITDFILVTSPNDQQIPAYFQTNPYPGIEIHFIEQPQPRGMAHALGCAESLIKDDFLLSACDSLIPTQDYANLLSSWRSDPQVAAHLTLMSVNPDQVSQTAVVQITNDFITQIIEKPPPEQALSNIASLPIYLLDRRIFPHLSRLKPSRRGEFELQDAIQAIIDHHERVRGVFISSRMNLTSIKDLLEINLYFLETEFPKTIQEPVQIAKNVVLNPPYYIGSNTSIADQSVIGPNVYIESNCHIDAGCSITNAILLEGSSLSAYQILDNDIIF